MMNITITSDALNELRDMLKKKNNDEIWALYGLLGLELRKRGELRSRNITAERGEAIALKIYGGTPHEPKLQLASPGTKNVDALSRDGKRYSIKTIRGSRTTGTFQADDFSEKRFNYLIIVILDNCYHPTYVLEAPWEVVDQHKQFHKTMKAFNISVTKKFKDECRVVFSKAK